jgi:hypothetical protein
MILVDRRHADGARTSAGPAKLRAARMRFDAMRA